MKTRYILLAAAPLALASVFYVKTAARSAPVQQRPDAVRFVPGGRALAGSEAGRKGATYYALEGRSTRVKTTFRDGTAALAERALDGDVFTTLRTAIGEELNRVRINRKSGIDDALQYATPGAQPIQALMDGSVRPTLDWVNRQSHHFHEDSVFGQADLRWRGGSIRRAGAGSDAGDSEDEASTVAGIETTWPNGLVASTRRQHLAPGSQFRGQTVRGDVLITTLTKDGVRIGGANYFVDSRVYAWDIPGLTSGLISDKELKQRHGGWTFTPDMTWMNLQLLGFLEWKTAIRQQRFVASAAPKPGILSRIAQSIVPTLHADEPGCDDLHWLDGTVYRFCCDQHDICYAKNGCTSTSWWQVWKSWSCDECNADVVWCFAVVTDGGKGLMI